MSAVARSLILDASPQQLGDALSRGLRIAVGRKPDPIGSITEAINCNRRSAQNIWRRDNLPNGMNLLRLMAAFPPVRVEIEKLMARPGAAAQAAWLAGDAEWWQPEYERERQIAVARAQRMGGGGRP